MGISAAVEKPKIKLGIIDDAISKKIAIHDFYKDSELYEPIIIDGTWGSILSNAKNTVKNFCNSFDYIISDCTEPYEKNPTELATMLGKEGVCLKVIIQTVTGHLSDAEKLSLISNGALDYVHIENKPEKPLFHIDYNNKFKGNGILYHHYQIERDQLLYSISKIQQNSWRRKFLVFGYNIFQYYNNYKYLSENFLNQYIIIKNGQLLEESSEDEQQLYKKFIESSLPSDSILIRKVELIHSI